MKLGILSESHGHLRRTEHALDLLREHGAEQLIHCGDLGGEDIVTLLFEQQENGMPVYAVPGNVDEWDPDLILYAKKIGLPLPQIRQVQLDQWNIAIYHGHDHRTLDRLCADPDFNLIFTGHTHVARDEQHGHLRIINPG
ncbi:MAG: YfcE family phosphodiesterase, partial [Kiritimatiellia bacterium]